MRLARISAALVLLATLAVLSSDTLRSQEKDKKAAKGQLPAGWSKLDLTDAQKEEILKLNAEYYAKREKLRQEMFKLDAELARKRVQVLTDEQRKKLVDLVVTDSLKDTAAERGKADPPEKPKGKVPDKR
jgi:hypothetical protein